jgi:hypothetical protein
MEIGRDRPGRWARISVARSEALASDRAFDEWVARRTAIRLTIPNWIPS